MGLQSRPDACKLIAMPELPDITAYISALEQRVIGQPLEHVRLGSPFLLRTVEPPLSRAEGRAVESLRRVGKRIAMGLEGDLWLVLHLMIAGRLHWKKRGAKLGGRQNLAAFDFPQGSLVLTEAGSKRRASLHVISGEENLVSLDAGGIDVFAAGLDSALAADGRALILLSTDGDADGMLAALARSGFRSVPALVRNYGNEVMTIYAVERSATP